MCDYMCVILYKMCCLKVYCYFHNPKSTVIRQFNDIDGNPQEGNVYQPVPVGNGDPEGAMEMR